MIDRSQVHISSGLVVLLLAISSFYAFGHDATDHGRHDATGPYPVEQKSFGIAGNPKRLTRTILMDMEDTMRFTPNEITVKQGDTIRFVIRNQGSILHEWVLGDKSDLAAHAALMEKFPNMEHNEVHMLHIAPGKTQQVVWYFNRPGVFTFACLMAGHYQAGMMGTVTVKP